MASIDRGMLERSDSESLVYSRMNSAVSYMSSCTDDEEFEILPLPESELDQEYLDGGEIGENQGSFLYHCIFL